LNQAMKQRLIGTVVLGCLALIFIPIFLDGEGVQEPTPVSVTVPPAPEITITPLPEPVRPVILSDTDALNIDNTPTTSAEADQQVAELDPAASPEASPPAAAEEENVLPPPAVQPATVTEPQLTSQGVPQGWSVRLGTFSNRTNAEALVASLILENYKAYSRPVQSGSQTMLAVYVGPVLTQGEATRLQEQLKTDQQLKDAVVVPFTIDTPVQGQ
jgi:DedD protein